MGFFGTIGYFICMPFAWLVRLFYTLTGSYGAAIILFTLVIKLILFPFQMKSKKSMMRMNRMSGKLQEIQKKYANNQAKMQEEIQKFYAEEGFNPMSGCLWSMLPLPILMALYSIIRQPITHFMMLGQDVLAKLVETASNAGIALDNIVIMKEGVMQMNGAVPAMQPYGQINLVNAIQSQIPDAVSGVDGWVNMNYSFLGLDLAAQPSSAFTGFEVSWAVIGLILIPLLAGGSQLLFTKISMKGQPQQAGAGSMKMMMWMMPLFSVYIAFIMPAALGIYWIAQSVFSLIQEFFMGKYYNEKMQKQEEEDYQAKEADRHHRMEEAKKMQEQQRKQAAQKQKKSLKEKRKAAQDAKSKPKKSGTTEAGRLGDRPYARGRSYQEDRYEKK